MLPRSKEGKTIPGVPCRDFLVDLFPEEILIAREIDKSLNPIERKDGNNKTLKNDDPRAAAIEKIKEIACRNASQAINWNVESDTYPRFVFRSSDPYSRTPFRLFRVISSAFFVLCCFVLYYVTSPCQVCETAASARVLRTPPARSDRQCRRHHRETCKKLQPVVVPGRN